MYTTLLMSTGLTFGTISSLFGLSHGIIDQGQYSALVAAVIGSAVIPTVIANAFYLPHHLLPEPEPERASESSAGSRAGSSGSHAAKGRVMTDVQQDSARQRRLGTRLQRARTGAGDRKQNNSELHMVSVEEIDYMPEFIEEVRRGDRDARRGAFTTVLQRARAMAEESQVKLHTHILAGHPVRDIVELAAISRPNCWSSAPEAIPRCTSDWSAAARTASCSSLHVRCSS